MIQNDKTNNNIILFRRINFLTLGLSLFFTWRKNPYSISYISGSSIILKALIFLSPNLKLTKINPIGHYHHNCYGKAIDTVDHVFEEIVQKSYFLKKILLYFKTDNYLLVFKKELLYELSNSFYVNEIAKEFLLKNTRVLIIDSNYFQYYSFIDSTKSSKKFMPSFFIRLPEMLNHYSVAFKNKIRLFLSFLYISLIVVIKVFASVNQKEFKIGVLVNNFRHQFKADGKYFDFIIDHKKIVLRDVIFIELENVPKSVKEKFAGHYFSGDIGYKNLINYGNSKILLRNLKKFIKPIFYSLINRNSLYLTKGITTIFLNSLRWECVISHYQFHHFITYNDESTSHIARNIVFNNNNIETWYYAHSAAMGYVGETINSNVDKRHILWSYLYYDNYITWNSAMKNFIFKHPVYFKNSHVIGCLWSQFIEKPSTPKKQKGIVVFDTSYIDNIKEGIKFYSDIVEYGLKKLDVHITFKPKKNISDYIPGKYFYGTKDYVKLQAIFNKIKEIPNMKVAEYNCDTYSLISDSSLVITHAISSPSLEAISAQIPALYYDPSNNYKNTIYSTVPNLIISKKEHLWDQIDALLNIDSIKYYQLQEKHYKGIIDDFFDRQSISRFRNLLLK